MKSASQVLSLILVFFVCILTGCTKTDDTAVREAVTKELDVLKELDSATASSYIAYADLFPNAEAQDTQGTSAEINEVFTLFFQDFDYKILDVDVDEDGTSAAVSVSLTTPDASSIAKDFTRSVVRDEIQSAVRKNGQAENSLEDRFLLLNHLLKTGTYPPVESECRIRLAGSEDGWKIKRTDSLENSLVGGLISYLSDPYLLTPEETLDIYLNTLKKMSQEDLREYLNIADLISAADNDGKALYEAVASQIHEHFSYEIKGSTVNGSHASVDVSVSSFDTDSVMAKYQEDMDAYLSTAEAVIGGVDDRVARSHELLVKALQSNSAERSTDVTFQMENDGVSWKPSNPDTVFADALIGQIQADQAIDDLSQDAES